MSASRLTIISLASAMCVAVFASDAMAQRHGGGRRGGGYVGRAAPRTVIAGGPRGVYVGPRRFITPRVVTVLPYRPYYYGYRPGLTIGFYAGFGGYPYRYPYAYGYPYYSGYPYSTYPYSSYPYSSYPYYSGYPYASGYGYGPSGYALPPPAYVSASPGYAYGGVRIIDAPPDAQVFVDNYYMGVVDDFDGPTQHLNLTSGPHQVEIRIAGYQPIAFNVNIQPGRTITYRAPIQ
jgi:PEGA domain-containing protein